MKFPRWTNATARPGLGLACALAVGGHVLAASLLGAGLGNDRRHVAQTGTAPVVVVTSASDPAREEPLEASDTETAARSTPDAPAVPPATQAHPPRHAAPAAHEARASATSVSPAGGDEHMAPAPSSPYWATKQLDVPPLPRSEPDSTGLQGLVATGEPIRLRLYIDAAGFVVNIEVLQASELDADVVNHVKDMFDATRFLPVRRNGVDVESYMDIDVNVRDLI